jgi:hypothetical protein
MSREEQLWSCAIVIAILSLWYILEWYKEKSGQADE